MNRQIVIGDIHGCYDELLRLLNKISPGVDDTVISLGDMLDRGPDSLKVFNLFRDRKNFECIIGNHERKHITGYYSYAQEITRLQFDDAYTPAIHWLMQLPYYREYDSAIVVHAAIEPGIPLEDQREDVLCGSSAGEKYLQNQFQGRPWYEFYEGNYWKKLKQEWQASVLYARPWMKMSWDQIDKEIGKIQYLLNNQQSLDLIQFVEWKGKIDQLMGEKPCIQSITVPEQIR